MKALRQRLGESASADLQSAFRGRADSWKFPKEYPEYVEELKALEALSDRFEQTKKRIREAQLSNDFRALKHEREVWAFPKTNAAYTWWSDDAALEREQAWEAEFGAVIAEIGQRPERSSIR